MPDEPVPEPVLPSSTPVRTFEWRRKPFEFFDHPYNATITNERAVEIPIAKDFLSRCAGVGLEVGNVLAHYGGGVPPRAVVDRYEEMPGVVNCDVFEIAGEYDWIVSISTLEHVRKDEHPSNPWGAAAAMLFLRGLLKPGGKMLITIGLGQHPTFDHFLLGTGQGEILVRERGATPDRNIWRPLPTHVRAAGWVPPAAGPTHGANSVWIGEW